MLTNAVWSMIELLVNPEVQVPDLVREAWISQDFASVASVSGQRRTDSIVCFVSEVVLEVVVEVPWWNLRSQSFDLIVWNFVQMSHDLLNSWKQKMQQLLCYLTKQLWTYQWICWVNHSTIFSTAVTFKYKYYKNCKFFHL